MRLCTKLSLFLFTLFLLASGFQSSSAMPNFARKYGMGCTGCHTAVPKLNEFGFQFRAAGFRLPDEIGKAETSKDMGDYFAGRTQASIDYVSSTSATDVTSNKFQLTFREFTFYPLTGAYAKNYSSLVELTVLPEDFLEIENAYVRANFGKETEHFSVRAGVFHPFEGYGASDRPIGISRPLFQGTPANYNNSTAFTPWGFDEMGIEAGYTREQFSVRLALLNGLFYNSGESKVFSAQGGIAGQLVKPAASGAYNSKDVELFANYILADDGGGISAYAYFGNLVLPTMKGTSYLNVFQRYALYAGYPVGHACLLAGIQLGTDSKLDTSGAKNGTFSSMGFFGEANYHFSDLVHVGARYDHFNPQTVDTDLIKNAVDAVSVFVNVPLDNGLQFLAEYQNKQIQKGKNSSGATLTQADNSAQIRLIFIY